MIPWMREKFAERRARWIAARKRSSSNTSGTAHADDINYSEEKNKESNSNSLDVCNETQWLDDLDELNFMNNSNNNSNGKVQIKILSPMGSIGVFKFSKMITISEIKLEALREFSKELLITDKSNFNDLSKKYKLITTKHQHLQLNEMLTLEQSHLSENDELILVGKSNTCSNNRRTEYTKGPTQLDIDLATNGLLMKKVSPPIVNIDELVLQSDVQHDIRRICISLAESAAYIIGAGPYAKRLIIMLKQRLISKRLHEIDAVQCLIDMGFSRAKVIHALNIKSNVYTDALDWLIANQSPRNLNSRIITSSFDNYDYTMNNLHTSQRNIESLLEIIRIYCQREIPASPEMVQFMTDMGFDEQDVREALRITKNNQSAACEWLIGNRNKNFSEIIDGLPGDSPILKALLNSPHVQLSLSNPKMFLAYIFLLEDYSTLGMWLGDSETSGIIGHILRTYHEEKHILAINQFSSLL